MRECASLVAVLLAGCSAAVEVPAKDPALEPVLVQRPAPLPVQAQPVPRARPSIHWFVQLAETDAPRPLGAGVETFRWQLAPDWECSVEPVDIDRSGIVELQTRGLRCSNDSGPWMVTAISCAAQNKYSQEVRAQERFVLGDATARRATITVTCDGR